MAKSIVSQKRFVKGVNSGTGILTEPPGTVTRISNLDFTQRGSLETVDGSAIIGQLSPPANTAVALGTYSNFSSGQYPYYPALVSPDGYIIRSPALSFGQIAGAATNAAGTYVFTVVGFDSTGTLHSDPTQSILTVVAPVAFDFISFTWPDQPGIVYTMYYLPGGATATSGWVVDSGIVAGSFGNSGLLATTPLVALPVGNNTFQMQVAIGSVAPPSKQVSFLTLPSPVFPANPPAPAQISPGDPEFQFQSANTQTSSHPVSAVSVSATFTGSGTQHQTSSVVSGFPSQTLSLGQIVVLDVSILSVLTGLPIGAGSAHGMLEYQYSPDGGSSWIAFYSWSETLFSGGTISDGPSDRVFNLSGLTNLNQLQIRIDAVVTSSSFDASLNGNIDGGTATVTVVSSFTPYGGVSGFVDNIPQILQFNQESILILGNGFQPQAFNPALLAGASLVPLSNTFQATYPNWQATVGWISGDKIAVLISSINYVFTAVQGGTSAATMPTFPTATGATVADGQVLWQNSGPLTTSIAPRGAAHGIVYAGSLWLYNTAPSTTADQFDGPTCLKMSDSNNQNSWNPVNVAFLGKDDGTQGTGLATYTVAELGIAPTGSLVAFKEFATYQIIGVFGATDFQITQAQTDLGCIASRSIQFVPGYGIMRFTHMGFAIFDGQKDRLVSEEIRPYLFGGIGVDADLTGLDFSFVYLSQGVQTSSPPMYACACPLAGAGGVLTRLFVYDLVLKAWTILDLPWPVYAMVQARTGEGKPLVIAGRADNSGIIERLFAGDATWDDSSLVPSITASQTQILWTFRTTHVYQEGSSRRAFYRDVIIRGHSTQPIASLVTILVTVDGNPAMSMQTYLEPQPFSNQFELDLDLMFTAQIVVITVSGQGVVTVDAMDWGVEAKPGGRLVIG